MVLDVDGIVDKNIVGKTLKYEVTVTLIVGSENHNRGQL